MNNVRIPKEFATTRRKLVAIPETEYRRWRKAVDLREQEVADVRASETEFRRGEFVTAPNIRVALKKARTRGWLD